jgi:hypothetical protein
VCRPRPGVWVEQTGIDRVAGAGPGPSGNSRQRSQGTAMAGAPKSWSDSPGSSVVDSPVPRASAAEGVVRLPGGPAPAGRTGSKRSVRSIHRLSARAKDTTCESSPRPPGSRPDPRRRKPAWDGPDLSRVSLRHRFATVIVPVPAPGHHRTRPAEVLAGMTVPIDVTARPPHSGLSDRIRQPHPPAPHPNGCTAGLARPREESVGRHRNALIACPLR